MKFHVSLYLLLLQIEAKLSRSSTRLSGGKPPGFIIIPLNCSFSLCRLCIVGAFIYQKILGTSTCFGDTGRKKLSLKSPSGTPVEYDNCSAVSMFVVLAKIMVKIILESIKKRMKTISVPWILLHRSHQNLATGRCHQSIKSHVFFQGTFRNNMEMKA